MMLVALLTMCMRSSQLTGDGFRGRKEIGCKEADPEGIHSSADTCLLPGSQGHPSAAAWQQDLACRGYPPGQSLGPGLHAQSS